jgi:hypothetical protein
MYLSLLVCIVGLLMYLLAKPDAPKTSWIGQQMFWVGLLAFLITGGPYVQTYFGSVRR